MNAKSHRTWAVILTGLGSLMAALDTLVVATALPTIRPGLGAAVEQLEWTVNAYNLSFAVLLMTGAALGDRYGRRSLYAIGLALFTAASAACALAPSAEALIAARAVQGAGAALLMPIGLALLTTAFPPEKRGAAIGLFSAVTGLAVASGPFIGGAVVQGLAWEWVFWLNVTIGLVAVPLVLRRLRQSYGTDSRLDIRGLALISAAAMGVTWGLVRGNPAGWDSLAVVGSVGAGLLLVAPFRRWALRGGVLRRPFAVSVRVRGGEPMLPMSFFRSRGFTAGNVATACTFGSLFTCVFFFSQLLQTALGYDALEAGLRLIPWTATFITVAPFAGTLSDRYGQRPFMTVGLLLQATGLTWVALIAEPNMTYGQLVI